MKKERLVYLDFIRAIAVIAILLTHYNAIYVYLWDEIVLKKVVLTWRVFNLYIGDFGVSLFLIVSGAALMWVYDNRLELKTFYSKRFISIYPMFWIAYFTSFLYSFFLNRGINQSIPKQNIIFSILGFDGYLGSIIPTFYQVGEWFLGFIIIVYLIFPVLRLGVKRYPKLTVAVTMIVYLIFNLYYPFNLTKSTCLFIRLPEILFGMYFVKYIKSVNWKAALISGMVLILNTILAPQFDKDFQTSYIGICSFILLVYLASFFCRSILVTKISKIISKYSYAVFLVHHYIILMITSKFDLYQITILESYILFVLCCCVICFFSVILYKTNEVLLNGLRSIKKQGDQEH